MTQETRPIPRHIAIIMDGNGRWAKQQNKPRFMGHKAGVDSVEAIVKHCAELGVEVLSLFAFSSENWRRPSKEVSLLMDLFAIALKKQVKRLHSNDIRLRIIGDVSRFSNSLQKLIVEAQTLTENNTKLTINIAANYGGRWDINQAVTKIAEKVKTGEIDPAEISESMISSFLTTSDLPEPDLFIRTGGEERVSNFLLWQLAYTEMYFTPVLWPDFQQAELDKAIDSFNNRERRFGRTSEQVQERKQDA
jgi:undecaprenyl diphosphate synthase